jgi:hypothetical protein
MLHMTYNDECDTKLPIYGKEMTQIKNGIYSRIGFLGSLWS